MVKYSFKNHIFRHKLISLKTNIQLFTLKSIQIRKILNLPKKYFNTRNESIVSRSLMSFQLPSSQNKSIDIIIPTYKRGSIVIELINLLTKQTKYGDSITVVWQNQEKPPLYHHSCVNFIHLSTPNLPAARNIGLNAGNNEIVLYLDDDIIPVNNFLDEHRKCYNNPQTGAVAGFIYDPLFLPSDKPSVFDFHTGQLIQNFSCNVRQKTISFMGAHMSFKRSVIENISGFNVHFIHNALWEEIDCAFRLLNTGFDIVFCPTAKVKHLRLSNGGCRTDKGVKNIYYYFVNTTFFSCNYIPATYFFDWFKFWKNRLEFLSRKNINKSSISYRYNYILAGFFGTLTGFIRFLVYGKRQKLPSAVIKNFENNL